MLVRVKSLLRQLSPSVQLLVLVWSCVFVWGMALTLYVHHVFVCFPLLTILVALLFVIPGMLRPHAGGVSSYLLTGAGGGGGGVGLGLGGIVGPLAGSVRGSGSDGVAGSKIDLIVRYTAIRDDESGFVDIDLGENDTDDGL